MTDYASLSRSLGALAYHIQQTGTADSQDAQTCLEVAEALRILLSNYKTAQANWELALERNAALIEHKRKQAEDIMTLGRLVYASSDPLITWMDRAEAAEARVTELEDLCNSLEAQAMGLAYDLKRAEDKLAEKDKEIAELREAVEPFSRLASVLCVGDADDAIVIGVSAGDLRRARNVGGNDDND